MSRRKSAALILSELRDNGGERRQLFDNEQRAALAAVNTRLPEPYSGIRVHVEEQEINDGRRFATFHVGVEGFALAGAPTWDSVVSLETKPYRKRPKRITVSQLRASGVRFDCPTFPPGATKTPASDATQAGAVSDERRTIEKQSFSI